MKLELLDYLGLRVHPEMVVGLGSVDQRETLAHQELMEYLAQLVCLVWMVRRVSEGTLVQAPLDYLARGVCQGIRVNQDSQVKMAKRVRQGFQADLVLMDHGETLGTEGCLDWMEEMGCQGPRDLQVILDSLD